VEKALRAAGYTHDEDDEWIAPGTRVARVYLREVFPTPFTVQPCTGCGGLAGECPEGQGCRFEP
jgi:hypothetical protein